MDNKINHYRMSYQYWRNQLGLANQRKAPAHARSHILRLLNKSRARLKNEMSRVAWLLWPETGRPYSGTWSVVNFRTNSIVFTGTMIRCIGFIERSRYGRQYRITKTF